VNSDKTKIITISNSDQISSFIRTSIAKNSIKLIEVAMLKREVEIALEIEAKIIIIGSSSFSDDVLEIIDYLKTNLMFDAIPIVLIASNMTKANILNVLNRGIYEFFPFPIDSIIFGLKINLAIERCQKLYTKEQALIDLNNNLETKVKERTKEIERKEKYIRNLLNSQPTLICVVKDGFITDANSKFIEFFEIDIDISEKNVNIPISYINNFIYRNLENNPQDTQLNAISWIKKFSNEADKSHKIFFQKEKEIFIFTLFVTPNNFEEDIIESNKTENILLSNYNYIITMSDITEQENIKETQLQQTKLASIGQMAAGIAHEINTPLTYMRGNVELLELDIEAIEHEETKEYFNDTLNTIKDGISRIALIVNTMREFAKNRPETKTKVNIIETLMNSLRMVYNRAKHVSVIYLNGEPFSLEYRPSQSQKYFREIVQQQIEQVWIIILNNALDELASVEVPFDKRFIRIEVQTIKDKVNVTFLDNAGGIKEEIVDKIFEPFISGKSHSGMGLGLNIAKKLLHEHNAEIEAFNTKNGACFSITI
jgi:C4-dicarboxylate-specific signal transduction histidine kinase